MKKATLGTKVTLTLLESNEIFAEGTFNNFNYGSAFPSMDEEIDFFSRITEIENYFEKAVDIPDEIYQQDWDAIVYISDLLRGETCYREWTQSEFTFTLSEDLKEAIANMKNTEYSFSVGCTVQVPLWDNIYELPIVRVFEAGKFENLEGLKRKVEVLDCGDIVKAIFVKSENPGKLCDTMRNEES